MARHAISSLAICVASFVLAACGTKAPTEPSEGGQPAGAVIVGTLSTTLSTLSLAGLSAQVVGTSLSAMVDDHGVFQLSGVPGGRVKLRFKNAGIDAVAELPDVHATDFIQIHAQLSATSAVIVDDVRSGKMSICHKEGTGDFHLIEISVDAEPAHRAHGDGAIGDPVPGQPLKTFDASCHVVGPSVEIQKSTNGDDADNAPGPSITVGGAVVWEYVVTNTGTVPLTGIVVTDDRGVSVNCGGVTTLAAGASLTCTGAGVAVLGQYVNVGRVTANWVNGAASGSVTASDASHYLGIAPEVSGGAKVTLCHKTGAGFYVEITVSVDAEPAHRAHGDGMVGEAVPGKPGQVFIEGCGVR